VFIETGTGEVDNEAPNALELARVLLPSTTFARSGTRAPSESRISKALTKHAATHISLNLGSYATSRLDGIDEGCRLGNYTGVGFILQLLQNIASSELFDCEQPPLWLEYRIVALYSSDLP
jgi:hypothetical protein